MCSLEAEEGTFRCLDRASSKNPNMQKKQCFANKLQVLKMRMLWSQAHSRKAITKWCSEALGGKSGEQEEEKGKRHFGSAKET